MSVVGVLISFFVVCTIAEEQISFRVCDDEGISPLFIPDGVDLLPKQPHAGSLASFKITGDAVRRVDEGSFHAEVFAAVTVHGKEMKVKLYEENKDLCSRTTCPIEKGPVEFHYDKRLPPITPPVLLLSTNLDIACSA